MCDKVQVKYRHRNHIIFFQIFIIIFKVTGFYSEVPSTKQLHLIQFYSGPIILITSFELLTILSDTIYSDKCTT